MDISDPTLPYVFGDPGGSSGSPFARFFALSDVLSSDRSSGLRSGDYFAIYTGGPSYTVGASYPGGVDSTGGVHGTSGYSQPTVEEFLSELFNPMPKKPAEPRSPAGLYAELTGGNDYSDQPYLLKSPDMLAQNAGPKQRYTYVSDGVGTFFQDGRIYDVEKNPDGSESTYRREGYYDPNTGEVVVISPTRVDVIRPPAVSVSVVFDNSPSFALLPPERRPRIGETLSPVPGWPDRTDPKLDRKPFYLWNTGNPILNGVLDYVGLIASPHLFAFLAVSGIDDALRTTIPVEYQPVQDLLPLQGAFGLALETGPAIDLSAAWLSRFSTGPRIPTNVSLASAFLGTGTGGGGFGRIAKLGPDVPLEPLEPLETTTLGRPLETSLPAERIASIAKNPVRNSLNRPEFSYRYLGETPVFSEKDWAKFQIYVTQSRKESVFQLVDESGSPGPGIFLDSNVRRLGGGPLIEAKYGDLGQLYNEERYDHFVRQSYDLIDISLSYDLPGVEYRVSTELGALRAITLFTSEHPEYLRSGFLNVRWYPSH